jgi:hypothetical protein
MNEVNLLEDLHGRPMRSASGMVLIRRNSRMQREARDFPILSTATILVLRKVTEVQLDDLLVNGGWHSKIHRQGNFAECPGT